LSTNGRERFAHTVEGRAARKRRARAHEENVWFGLGMFGLVGWSVTLPALAGIAVGAWLDGRSDDPRISWTLTGLAVGVAVGCALAWYWVRQESARGADTGDDAGDDAGDGPPGPGERPAGTGGGGRG